MEIKQVRINGQLYDLVTKTYVQETIETALDEFAETMEEVHKDLTDDIKAVRDDLTVEYNTPYDAETNKVATMADIEKALYIDEEELV